MMTLLSNISEIAKETLWPTRCAICDTPGDVICKECMKRIDFIDACQACERCGAPYSKNQCTECNDVMIDSTHYDSFPLDQQRHAVALNEETLRIVKVYKDAHERRLCEFIASTIARYIEPTWTQAGALLTFIPASAQAYSRRGFDHMEEIALEISNRTSLPLMSVFERPRSSDQRSLGKKERIANMEDTIVVRSDPALLSHPNSILQEIDFELPIIVCDDVSTSGSTLYAAAKALKTCGYKTVYGLTFGKVLD